LKPVLITVVGPTAIGKTAFAIKLAKHFNCEIISCDSRQFYKEMNIGTAVPSAEELTTIPHHFIQHISIHDTYNVGKFELDALTLLEQLFQKNPIQVMVGGSGLYVDAVTKGFDDFPDIDEEKRNLIRVSYQEKGLEFLQHFLAENDPEYYNQLKNNNPQTLKNPQRLMRFCEVCLGTGKPYSYFIKGTKNERNFTVITVGLEAPREVMYERINKRVDIMMKEGLLDEVKHLQDYAHLNALQTVGYKELFSYFEGQCTLENSIEEIKKNTRRFAKRQLTWFKRNLETLWFPYDYPLENSLTTLEKLVSDAHR
jgi:tRNA dimethylallyltransferase